MGLPTGGLVNALLKSVVRFGEGEVDLDSESELL